MSEPENFVSPQRVRSAQIIAGALLIGLLNFCLITLWLVLLQNGGHGLMPNAGIPFVTWAAIAMSLICLPLSFLLPNFVTKQAIKQIVAGKWQQNQHRKGYSLTVQGIVIQQIASYMQRKAAASGQQQNPNMTVADQLVATYQTSLIMGLALLEGAGFMSLMAYMMEARWISLFLAGAIVAIMLARFPTSGRIQTWMLQQADLIEQLKQEC